MTLPADHGTPRREGASWRAIAAVTVVNGLLVVAAIVLPPGWGGAVHWFVVALIAVVLPGLTIALIRVFREPTSIVFRLAFVAMWLAILCMGASELMPRTARQNVGSFVVQVLLVGAVVAVFVETRRIRNREAPRPL
ncbi:MAG: hypothetical protein ABI338_00595 [Gemmatimonadaceae bacterium]